MAATAGPRALRPPSAPHGRDGTAALASSAAAGGRRLGVTAVRSIGLAALVFSALYLLSDVIEAVQGGFSDGQLWLTLVAEAAIPVFVVGLAAVHPRLGRLGWLSASAYAVSYVVYVGTVVFALVKDTPDYATLSEALGPVMLVPGAVMVFAGLGFGLAVARAGLLPRWTAASLVAGVVLVAAGQGLPEGLQVVAAGIRDSASPAWVLRCWRAHGAASEGTCSIM